jgi:2-hydroxychromene-2-carboxylate isomerase
MNKPVEFFFDFISPFGWFAAERIGGIVRAHGRNVAWKPLLLGVTVKQAMGLPAVLQTPLKGPYLLHDAERCARLYRLPWRPPTADHVLFRCCRARGCLGSCSGRPGC